MMLFKVENRKGDSRCVLASSMERAVARFEEWINRDYGNDRMDYGNDLDITSCQMLEGVVLVEGEEG